MNWNTYHEQVAEVVGGTYAPVYIPTDILVEVAPKYAGGTRDIFAWTSIFDNSKIKRDADWPGQTVSWKEGVRRTVAWMEANDKIQPVADDEYEDRLAAAWGTGVASSLPKQA
jgi:nucleoside-diphosphate-sugar epimerase